MIILVTLTTKISTYDATVTDAISTTECYQTETTTMTVCETTTELQTVKATEKAKVKSNLTYYREATPSESAYKLTVVATAYCPCRSCSGNYGSGTAIGTVAKEGRTIAVDPRVIPLGSKVIINGNVYVAEDVGGAIKGNKIDIYFNSHSAVESFGRQRIDVYVVR